MNFPRSSVWNFFGRSPVSSERGARRELAQRALLKKEDYERERNLKGRLPPREAVEVSGLRVMPTFFYKREELQPYVRDDGRSRAGFRDVRRVQASRPSDKSPVRVGSVSAQEDGMSPDRRRREARKGSRPGPSSGRQRGERRRQKTPDAEKKKLPVEVKVLERGLQRGEKTLDRGYQRRRSPAEPIGRC